MSPSSTLELSVAPDVVRIGDRGRPRQLTVVMHISADHGNASTLAAQVIDAVRTAVETPPAPLRVVDFGKTADLRIDTEARQVSYRGDVIAFTRLEYDLLAFLCQHPRRVHRRAALLAQVWKFPDNSPSERTIDIHVRRIRKKLGPEFDLITTVRGIGYRLDPGDQVEIS
ncbi:winged helix-turn-helix domain-containing protein [Fodinicola acaciae]|uniref:winged helix-turn-helix domain-containing protein n=1 Tax=Fodinicola acaciae TaxID=2681555 RepID=UPI0013D2833C|nr:winged helix-turn-helix domain-containing protein [Fodinicola acaciae]